MINSQKIHICIAGLGTIGSSLIDILDKDHQLILKKTNIDFNILGISAKNKSKKRIFDINKYQWLDDPFELVNNNKCDSFIELTGEDKGV